MQLIALFAVLILLYYIAAFAAVFVLRYRSPEAIRPYKAFGYPIATLVVLVGSIGFLVASSGGAYEAVYPSLAQSVTIC